MGQKDLGTCLILSTDDVKKLHVNLDKLVLFCVNDTPYIRGISETRIKKKLRKYIESVAFKEDADVAVITSQSDSNYPFTQGVNYTFHLYAYK